MRQKDQVRFLRMVVVLAAMGMLAVGGVGAPPAVLAYQSQLYVSVTDRDDPALYETLILNKTSASGQESYTTRTDMFNFPYSAQASGSLDMVTGKIKFYLKAEGYNAIASAGIFFTEDIFPKWTLSTKTDPMNVEISWEAHGTYVAPPSLFNLSLSARFYYALDNGPWNFHSTDQFNLIDGIEKSTINVAFTPGVNQFIKVGMSMGGSLDPYNSQTATADFANTGLVQVTMPDGALFTSSSGVFLTGNDIVVPLPGTLLLVGSGLAGVLWLSRRRQLL